MVYKNSILIILPATNFSETEYLSVKTVLANSGFNTFTASDANGLCVGQNGLKVKADVSFFNMHENNFIAIIFIGGPGVKKYWINPALHSIANKFQIKNKIIGAICSSPVILAKAGLLSGREATCFESDKQELEKEGVTYKNLPIVISKNIITANGPSSAYNFAEKFVEKIKFN